MSHCAGKLLKNLPVTIIIGLLSEGLIGCMLICDSSGAALGSSVPFTWEGAVLGPFKKSK